jgi:hypothetical protein
MKFIKYTSILLLSVYTIAFFIAKQVTATENPQSVPNNKFGIHILDEDELTDAAKLVNSSGGDWGYVTLVIRRDERDIKKWQRTFDKMRRLQLIPIVRIATTMQENYWDKFEIDDIDSWVYFLNSLNWVVKNRYVVIGNEPNHAKEWGGGVNPEEYARFYYEMSKLLKESNEDFFVMPAGFDASAPNDKAHMSQELYLKRMVDSQPNVFEYTDGWSSHSYPNPAFSGSVDDNGRGSIRTYEWELEYLAQLGVNKSFPVFITETGWAHDKEGRPNGYLDTATIAQRLKNAFESVWNDDKVVAVTPFLLNYNSPPFDIFSWRKPDGEYYEMYGVVQNIAKIKGEPKQEIRGELLNVIIPPIIKRGENLVGIAFIKNNGQAIWYPGNSYTLHDGSKDVEIEPIFLALEPQNKGFAYFRTLTNGASNN